MHWDACFNLSQPSVISAPFREIPASDVGYQSVCTVTGGVTGVVCLYGNSGVTGTGSLGPPRDAALCRARSPQASSGAASPLSTARGATGAAARWPHRAAAVRPPSLAYHRSLVSRAVPCSCTTPTPTRPRPQPRPRPEPAHADRRRMRMGYVSACASVRKANRDVFFIYPLPKCLSLSASAPCTVSHCFPLCVCALCYTPQPCVSCQTFLSCRVERAAGPGGRECWQNSASWCAAFHTGSPAVFDLSNFYHTFYSDCSVCTRYFWKLIYLYIEM